MMSLFPAYGSTPVDTDNSAAPLFPSYADNVEATPVTAATAEPISTAETNENQWLQNKSFAKAVEKNDVTISDDDIIVLADTTVPVKKKKKQQTSKKVLPKTTKRKPGPLDGIPEIKRTVDWDLLPSTSFRSPKSFLHGGAILFCVDRRKDVENIQFGECYKKHVSKYNYAYFAKKRHSLIENSAQIQKLLFGKLTVSSETTENRYFGRKKRSLLKLPSVSVLPEANSKWAKFESESEFLPVNSSGASDTAEHCTLVFDPATGMYKDKRINYDDVNADQMIEDFDVDNDIINTNRTLNTAALDDPTDVGKWFRLIDFQDHFYSSSLKLRSSKTQTDESLKVTVKGLADRKLAIIDRALKHNAKSLELKLKRLEIAELCLDFDHLKQDWKNVEFMHVNEPEMWIGQLKFIQSSFNHYTISSHLVTIDRCIQKLIAIRSGNIVSHVSRDNVEHFIVEIIIARARLLFEAGFTEKAVACMQACVEFNLYLPKGLADLPAELLLNNFEIYWESSIQGRIGDELPVCHWLDFVKTYGSGQMRPDRLEPVDVDKLEEEVIQASTGDNDSLLWLRLEELRMEYDWRPWREPNSEAEDPADPDRIVMFEDVSPVLINIDALSNRFRLACGFLKMLGAQLPKCNSSAFDNPLISESDLSEFDCFLDRCSLNDVDFHGSEVVLANLFSSLETLFSGTAKTEPAYSLYFKCGRMLTQCQVVLKNQTLSTKEKHKAFKAWCKDFLMTPANRNEVLLYHFYAECLQKKFANSTEAKSALFSAVEMVFQQGVVANTIRNNVSSKTGTRPSFEYNVAMTCIISYVKLCCGLCTETVDPGFDEAKMVSTSVFLALQQLPDSDTKGFGELQVLKARKQALYLLESLTSISDCSLFVQSWLGSALSLSAELRMLLEFARHATDVEIQGCLDHMLDTFGKLPIDSWSIDQASQVSECLDANMDSQNSDLERFYQTFLEIVVCRHRKVPVKQQKYFRTAVSYFPGNPNFLVGFCRSKIQGLAMFELRRFFATPLKNCTNWWLAAICAEQLRGDQLARFERESNEEVMQILGRDSKSVDGRNFVSLDHVRHLFEKILELRGPINISLLRRYVLFEVSQSQVTSDVTVNRARAANAKRMYYEVLQRLPLAKHIYFDAIRYWPMEYVETVDMMTEKELRLRLPLEELQLLKTGEKTDENIDDLVE